MQKKTQSNAEEDDKKTTKLARPRDRSRPHGLIFAAMAGYDPNVAVSFWQRMAASGGSSTAEFLSDHPSDATRINNIKNKFLPEALKYYTPPVVATTPTSTKKATTTKKTTTAKKTTAKKTTTKKK